MYWYIWYRCFPYHFLLPHLSKNKSSELPISFDFFRAVVLTIPTLDDVDDDLAFGFGDDLAFGLGDALPFGLGLAAACGTTRCWSNMFCWDSFLSRCCLRMDFLSTACLGSWRAINSGVPGSSAWGLISVAGSSSNRIRRNSNLLWWRRTSTKIRSIKIHIPCVSNYSRWHSTLPKLPNNDRGAGHLWELH